jgi:hypothetical protein
MTPFYNRGTDCEAGRPAGRENSPRAQLWGLVS